jgi:hypothetical protein
VYPDPDVASTVSEEFVPVRIHIKEQPKEFQRFGAEWTPTVIVLDPGSRAERHRIEGFLPKDEFLAQLSLALGQFAFGRQQWDEAERRFRDVAEKYSRTDAGPEGVYWAGVSRYKKTNDPAALKATWTALKEAHPESTWTKKASVWSG